MRERNAEIEKAAREWAAKAWASAHGDWDKAEEKFITISEREFPKLAKATREAMEYEVWRFYSNNQISKIFTKNRSASRVVPGRQTKANSVQAPTRRTREAMEGNEEVYEQLFLDAFSLTTGKTTLRYATFDQLTVEAEMRKKKSKTLGKDAKLLFTIHDKMEEAGCEGNDLVGDYVDDDFAEKLRAKIY